MMSRDEILGIIREHADRLREQYSAERIGLFGSGVREAAGPESDVDILVLFGQPSFDNYMGLKEDLESMLGSEVDLVLSDALKPRIRPQIEREVVYA